MLNIPIVNKYNHKKQDLLSATGLFAIFVTYNSGGGTMHYTLKDHQGNLTATIHGSTVERLWYDDNNSLKGESRNEKYHKKYHPHNSSGGYNHPAASGMPRRMPKAESFSQGKC